MFILRYSMYNNNLQSALFLIANVDNFAKLIEAKTLTKIIATNVIKFFKKNNLACFVIPNLEDLRVKQHLDQQSGEVRKQGPPALQKKKLLNNGGFITVVY